MKSKYENKRPNIPASIERQALLETGHKCSIAGCDEHTYLEFHHINNNREDNRIENIIVLCDKHHKMAHANHIDRKSLQEYKNRNLIQNVLISKKYAELINVVNTTTDYLNNLKQKIDNSIDNNDTSKKNYFANQKNIHFFQKKDLELTEVINFITSKLIDLKFKEFIEFEENTNHILYYETTKPLSFIDLFIKMKIFFSYCIFQNVSLNENIVFDEFCKKIIYIFDIFSGSIISETSSEFEPLIEELNHEINSMKNSYDLKIPDYNSIDFDVELKRYTQERQKYIKSIQPIVDKKEQQKKEFCKKAGINFQKLLIVFLAKLIEKYRDCHTEFHRIFLIGMFAYSDLMAFELIMVNEYKYNFLVEGKRVDFFFMNRDKTEKIIVNIGDLNKDNVKNFRTVENLFNFENNELSNNLKICIKKVEDIYSSNKEHREMISKILKKHKNNSTQI